MIAGLGAAAADTIFGAIAAFSINFVIRLLIRELFWIRLVGGILLIGIGILYYFKRAPLLDEQRIQPAHSDFVSAFLLTLTNPTVILSFLAVLAGLGMSEPRAWWLSWILVAGVFSGGMLWWTILVFAANRFRGRCDERALLWMNRIAGLAIGAFGVVTLILSQTKS